MPSVGMRRSMRVIGARVLRSGRRLWSVKVNNAEWIELLDNYRDGGGDATKRKERGRQANYVVPEQNVREMDVDKKVVESTSENVVCEAVVANDHVGRRWGNVYTRKRRKVDSSVSDFPSGGDLKKFGKHYCRRKLRKKVEEMQILKGSDPKVCSIRHIGMDRVEEDVTTACVLSGREVAPETLGVLKNAATSDGCVKLEVSSLNDTGSISGPSMQLRSHFIQSRSSLRSKRDRWRCKLLEAAETVIPVPGVREVPGYVNNMSVFCRPASYIRMEDDELSRALARRTANYDMDSEDEEWLSKFNEEFSDENPDYKLLSREDFEFAIDAFERGFFWNPDKSDDCTIPQINLILERRVIEALHRFWHKKRKQKHSALVKVFQLYKRRRTQLLPNSVLRKKRSFKRQGGSVGRGNQRSFRQALSTEQGTREQSAIVKMEEAKAAANRSEGLAFLKRRRAQKLMENADMATYKATMALKIAELARNARSPDTLELLFPD